MSSLPPAAVVARRREIPLAGCVVLLSLAVCLGDARAAAAQGDGHPYIGGLFGVSTLSGDARSVTTADSASASLYKPENGPALNLFAGAHLARYFTVQANYVYNANALTLFASTTSAGGAFYEQPRKSFQHALVADALVYFRARSSGIRPYLGTGVGVVRFRSTETASSFVMGLQPPQTTIENTGVALRVHVGIDVALTRGWSFRYSFSETITGNPVSDRLTPPGQRGLMNFQNLFGLLKHF